MQFVSGYTRDGGFGDAQWTAGSLAPKFFWAWESDASVLDESGLPKKRNVPKIELYFDNGLSRFVDRVWEDQSKVPSADRDWIRRFPFEWKLFIEGRGDEIVGTPLEDVFRGNPARVEYYKRFNILTAEQLMNTSDANISGLGMGAHADRETCKKYMAVRKDGAVYEKMAKEKEELEAKLAERDERSAAQSAKIDALTEQLSALTAMISEDVKKGGKLNKQPR